MKNRLGILHGGTIASMGAFFFLGRHAGNFNRPNRGLTAPDANVSHAILPAIAVFETQDRIR